jgi:hypothetical protein
LFSDARKIYCFTKLKLLVVATCNCVVHNVSIKEKGEPLFFYGYMALVAYILLVSHRSAPGCQHGYHGRVRSPRASLDILSTGRFFAWDGVLPEAAKLDFYV